MRERISVPSVVLVMKSFAPAARARFLVESSSSPEITMTGMVLTRASSDLRIRSSKAKPSRFGICISEHTTTIEGSVEIACQPASPSASSRTSKLLRIRRAIVVRTIRESSTRSTRCLGMVVTGGVALMSGRHVHHDPPPRCALQKALERAWQIVERDGARHLLQVGGAHVAREPPPHFLALNHGRGAGIDAEEAHTAQDEGGHGRVEAHARSEADRGDG